MKKDDLIRFCYSEISWKHTYGRRKVFSSDKKGSTIYWNKKYHERYCFKMHSHIENPYGDDNGDVVYSYLASNSEMDNTLL